MTDRTLTDADVQAIAAAISKPRKRHGHALRLLRNLVASSSHYADSTVRNGDDSVLTKVARARLDGDLDEAAQFMSKLDGGRDA